MKVNNKNLATLLLYLFITSGCSYFPDKNDTYFASHQPVGIKVAGSSDAAPYTANSLSDTGRTKAPLYEIIPKQAEFFKTENVVRTASEGGDIMLNFNQTDLHEVVRIILGEILNRNYVIHDSVRGKVSLNTSQAITQDSLIPTLDSLLYMHGAVLHDNGTLIEVLPADAVQSAGVPRLQLDNAQGYQTLVVPLRYISVKEMEKILRTVASDSAVIDSDQSNNLLLLTASGTELATLLSTIRTFDVNQLKGMSIGLFQLRYVTPETIIGELESVFGDTATGPVAGLLRFVAIERLNTVMAITPQPQYLDSVQQWVGRLDRKGQNASPTLHVYKVKYGKAEYLASLLDKLFRVKKRPSVTSGSAELSLPEGIRNTEYQQPSGAAPGGIRVIADKENNSLLIMATESDYEGILLSLQQLDVLPHQVLVEATIVEVSLSGDLNYGIDWFFKNGFGGEGLGSETRLTSPQSSTGFSYRILDTSGNIRALFTALASDNRINIVSSPSLMVLDNQSATIKVGDQVPVSTSETVNTSNNNNNLITTSVQYRDTGVLLEVTPQIKNGGLVVLDINQDVSDASVTTSSGIQSPTINQRQIQTTVAVQSGNTLVLGGLIRETKDSGTSGIPGLKDLPGVGVLFGSTGKKSRRTELVVLITPTAIRNQNEAIQVTEEFKLKMKGLSL